VYQKSENREGGTKATWFSKVRKKEGVRISKQTGIISFERKRARSKRKLKKYKATRKVSRGEVSQPSGVIQQLDF